MEIPRYIVDNATKSLESISDAARAALSDVLSGIDYGDESETIRLIKAAMSDICGVASYAAAEVSAALYNSLRLIQLGELGEAAAAMHEYSAASTDGAVSAIVQSLVDGDPERMERELLDRVGYEVNRAAGDSIIEYGARDSARVRYARVPSGGETCRFCLMLASRGFVYATPKAAGEGGHYHANCRCRIVPGFGDTSIEGYDPESLYRQWRESQEEHQDGV